jgi:hypothetical protein
MKIHFQKCAVEIGSSKPFQAPGIEAYWPVTAKENHEGEFERAEARCYSYPPA